MADVRWPAKAVAASKEDLLAPTQDFLRGLDLLRKEGEAAAGLTTPQSVQVLQSGATAASKWTGGVIAAGSAVGVWAYLEQGFGGLDNLSKAVALLGVALIISSAVIAIAVIVRSDVLARARGTEARLSARRGIVEEFLRASAKVQERDDERSDIAELAQAISELQKKVDAEEHILAEVDVGTKSIEATLKNIQESVGSANSDK